MNIFDEMAMKPGPFQVQEYDPYDMDAVRQRFEPYRLEVEDMRRRADAFRVVSDESEVTAVEMANQAKKLAKAVDVLTREIITDPDNFVKSARSFARSFTDPLSAIPKALGQQLIMWRHGKELERRKREEIERRAVAELQKRLDAEAEAARVEPVKIEAPVLKEAPNVTRTAEGSAHVRKTWVGEVMDPSLVPARFYLDDPVDRKKIAQAVAGGVREIPGVNIYEKSIPAFRG